MLRALIRDCIAHDRKAQRTFYERFAPWIYNVIKRYVFQDEPAQEILNDTFIKIFNYINQYSGLGPIEAWMRRIAVNAITDHLRKYLKHEKLVSGDVDELKEEDISVESDAVNHLAFADLMKFVHRLPASHGAVFNLFVFEQFPHKEIAELLQISNEHSRWILNDARKRLRQMIITTK